MYISHKNTFTYKNVIWALLIVCLTLLTNPGSYAGEEYCFVPEDKVGDFSLSIEGERTLKVSWKGINLLSGWGRRMGFNTEGLFWIEPIAAKQSIRGVSADAYYKLHDQVIRVKREKDRVEYEWGYSLPGIGFRQVNRVVATPKKVFSDVTIEFYKKPEEKIYTRAILFPGSGENTHRTLKPEQKILGMDCMVRNIDGNVHQYKYPDVFGPYRPVSSWEEISKTRGEISPWLPENSREVISVLRQGKIRFGFSFSDPSSKLLFYANMPYEEVWFNSVGLIAKMSCEPGKNTGSDGIYRNTFHLEIAVDEETEQRVSKPEPVLNLSDRLDIDVIPQKLGHIFLPDEDVEFELSLDNFSGKRDRTIKLNCSTVNYSNRNVWQEEKTISIKPGEKIALPAMIGKIGRGIYSLDMTAMEGDAVIGKRIIRFAVLPSPVDIPPEKSFFGNCFETGHLSMKILVLEYGLHDELVDTLKLMHRIGIKKLRTRFTPLNWQNLEKEPGKFEFDPEDDKVIDLIIKNGFDIWIAGSQFESFFPDWAIKKDEKIKCEGGRISYMPKDFALYENYVYEVVKHLKGRITYFEMDNEPECPVEIREKFLAAAYRGAKRANPESVILGASIPGLGSKQVDWAVSLLQLARNKNERILDIFSGHYYFCPFWATVWAGPDLHLPKVEELGGQEALGKIIKEARKQKIRIWNGEDGISSTIHCLFPEKDFLPYEKDYVNMDIRHCLLMLSMGVEHSAPCWGMGAALLGWPIGTDIGPGRFAIGLGGRFFGTGGYIKPVGAARAVLADLIEGAKFERRIPLGDEKAWGLLFRDRDNNLMAALWHQQERGTLALKLEPEEIELLDIMGNKIEATGNPVKIRVSEEPVYLFAGKKASGRAAARPSQSPKNGLLGLWRDMLRRVRRALAIGPGEKAFIQALESAVFVLDSPLEMEAYIGKDKKNIRILVRNKMDHAVVLDEINLIIISKAGEIPHAHKGGIKLEKREIREIEFPVSDGIETPAKLKIMMKADGHLWEKELTADLITVEEAKKEGLLIAQKTEIPPEIDGIIQKNEWGKAVPIMLDREDQVMLGTYLDEAPKWKGPDDLSAIACVMWDKDYLYLAFKVKDDFYANPNHGADCWNGDSIQMVIDTMNDSSASLDANDQNISIALTSKGPETWRVNSGNTEIAQTGPIPGAKLAIEKKKGEMIYEMAVPFKELRPLYPVAGKKVRFNFIVNDNDGKKRDKWIGITGGIGERKDPTLYKELGFVE